MFGDEIFGKTGKNKPFVLLKSQEAGFSNWEEALTLVKNGNLSHLSSRSHTSGRWTNAPFLL